MSGRELLAVSVAALPLAVVVGGLLTRSVWIGPRPAPGRFVPAMLALHAGAVTIGGVVAVAAAVRSWQVVGEPEEQAGALLEVSRIDGDSSLYALLVLALVAATALVAALLAMATRFAASAHPVDRSIACAVIGIEIGVCGLGLAWLAGGSRAPLAVLAVLHLPVLGWAMVRCWPPHHPYATRPRREA